MDWIDKVVRDVAELPDRNSPTDWPEAMLVTADELRDILIAATADPGCGGDCFAAPCRHCDGQPHIGHNYK